MGHAENIGEPPRRDSALFLDIDGTLLEIAAQPDTVIVPEDLAPTLEAVSAWLGGALAVVSGRPLTVIDHLLSPLTLPCAAEHGAQLRLADGTLLEPGHQRGVPALWRGQILAATRDWTGVLVGNKAFSVAVHYRMAPDRERDVRALVHNLVGDDPEFEVLPARMAYEIRHRRLNKGEAIRTFMKTSPFERRIPIFVGDDVTDEDGFRVVREMGGLALHVDEAFGGQPANVRTWLNSFAG